MFIDNGQGWWKESQISNSNSNYLHTCTYSRVYHIIAFVKLCKLNLSFFYWRCWCHSCLPSQGCWDMGGFVKLDLYIATHAHMTPVSAYCQSRVQFCFFSQPAKVCKLLVPEQVGLTQMAPWSEFLNKSPINIFLSLIPRLSPWPPSVPF